MSNYIQITTTTETRTLADEIAEQLVAKRLVVCVHIVGPIRSVYRWNNAVESGEEWLCIAKTRRALYEPVEAAIRAMHSYDVPEILATEIVAGSADYLECIEQETADVALLEFDSRAFVRPSDLKRRGKVEVGDTTVTELGYDPASVPLPFAITFEQAVEKLVALDERIHTEPDGWFIWHSPASEQPKWQINGHLHDLDDRLQFVSLRGTCPPDIFEKLLAALIDNPRENVMFSLTQAGVYVDFEELLAYSQPETRAVEIDDRRVD